MNGVLKALAVKEDGEDLLIAAVHQQVITGSESVFSLLMMHGVNCDFDKITSTYPKGKDGRDVSRKEYLKHAQMLSEHMANFLVEWNAKKKVAREQRRNAKGESSGRAAGSST
jgi:outer membrane receptor for ferrienterochelin and colicin